MWPGLTLARCQLVMTATATRVSRVAAGPLCLHAVALTPAGPMEPVRSYYSISVGLPSLHGRSAPALIVSRPAQRSLMLRPACSPSRLSDPLHRRLRRLRFLHRRSDYFFYEKVIKVKADVAALLINCFPSASPSGGDVGSCQGRPAGTFIWTLDSSPRHFKLELGTKRNAVQWSFVP